MVSLYYLNSWFFTTPLMIVAILFFCKRCQVESPFKRRAFMSGILMILMPLWFAIDYAVAELIVGIAGRPGAHFLWYLAVAALLCAEGAATWWLYRTPYGENQAVFDGSRPAIVSQWRRSIMSHFGNSPSVGEDRRLSRMGRVWSWTCGSDTLVGQRKSCESEVKGKWSMWSWMSRGTPCDVPPLGALPNGTSPDGDTQGPVSSVVFESI